MEEANPQDNMVEETSGSPIASSQSRPFLSLAYDVRLCIYEHLLTYSGPNLDGCLYLHNAKEWKGQFGANRGCGVSPEILSTCKTIYEEAASVLYGHNRITLPTYSSVRSLKGLGDTLGHVRHLDLTKVDVFGRNHSHLESWDWRTHFFEYLVRSAPKVTHLRLDVKKWHTRCEVLPMLGWFGHLKRITLMGFYPRSWIVYLEEMLNISIITEVEHWRKLDIVVGETSESGQVTKTEEFLCGLEMELASFQAKVARDREYENPFDI